MEREKGERFGELALIASSGRTHRCNACLRCRLNISMLTLPYVFAGSVVAAEDLRGGARQVLGHPPAAQQDVRADQSFVSVHAHVLTRMNTSRQTQTHIGSLSSRVRT